VARAGADQGRRNLELLNAATADMSTNDLRELSAFLLGWAAAYVPEDAWSQGIAEGMRP
jgi:hypothetical protein